MSGRFATLAGDWSLRGWTDVQWATVNWMTGTWFELTKKAFYVAEACDGQTDFESLAFLPEHRALLDAMIAGGVAKQCPKGTRLEPWRQYRKANNPLIRIIHWGVTGRCNLNCRHCYMQSPSGRYGELPFERVLNVIDEFKRANLIQVALTGGEPLIRKDLLQIMTVLAESKVGVRQIYSNGVLLSDEFLDGLRALGFAPIFQISFDGVGRHEHWRRREGIESRVIAGIRRLREAGLSVIVATNVDRGSIGCLGATYEALLTLDIQAWRVGVPLAIGNWQKTSADLSFDEQAEVYTPLLERWLADGKPFEIALGHFLWAAGGGKALVTREPKILHRAEGFDCGSCRENPALLPDGTLLPCAGYVDSILEGDMPNILTEGLSGAWTSSLLRALADIKKRDLLLENPECAQCSLFGNCGVGCRASAVRETGRVMAKDPVACRLWKGRYKQRFYRMARRGPDWVQRPSARA